MTEPLEPLEPELARLLRAERNGDAMPESADAIFARVSTTMGWPLPGGHSGGGGPADDGAGGGGAGGPIGAAAAGAAHGVASAGGSLVTKAIVLAAFSFAAGAGTHAVLVSPRTPSAPVAHETPSPIADAPLASSGPDRSPDRDDVAALPSSSATTIASAAARRVPPHASAAATTPSSELALAQERDVIQGARMAFVRGQTSAARTLLDEHESRFPHGQLVEEREVLRIQALAREGRIDEAHARADRFRRSFPQSLSLGAIDAALTTPR